MYDIHNFKKINYLRTYGTFQNSHFQKNSKNSHFVPYVCKYWCFFEKNILSKTLIR